MIISKAWNKKVQQANRHSLLNLSLFGQQVKYQSGPIDALELITNEPLTLDFVNMLTSLGTVSRNSTNYVYRRIISLGVVTVLQYPKFANATFTTKIKINPSEGGLSAQQLLEWVRYMVGNENKVSITRIEHKLDYIGMETTKCMSSIWCNDIRKVNDESFKGETLYLGGRRSKKQGIIYDKAKEQEVTGYYWTRIEMRKSYSVEEHKPFLDIFNVLMMPNPFDDMLIIEADMVTLRTILQPYKVRPVRGSMVKTFRQLKKRDREAVFKALDEQGYLKRLSMDYMNEMKKWLVASPVVNVAI